MATQDPMCHQAWQTEPGAMWNWNGLFREGVAGNHQAAIPDGRLCGAGLTHNDRYRALDTPDRLNTVDKPTSFRLNPLDQSYYFCSDVNFR